MTESPPCFHWTPAARARFIETLARTGSVVRAAEAAGKTRGAAYQLRRRKGESGFARAWDAAVLVARDRVGDDVFARAFAPIEYVRVANACTGRRHWRRADPLLGRGMGAGLIDRLDRMAAQIERDPARKAAAQPGVGWLWDRFAAQIETGTN